MKSRRGRQWALTAILCFQAFFFGTAAVFVEEGRPVVPLSKLKPATARQAVKNGYVQIDDMRFRLDDTKQSALGGWKWTAGTVYYQFNVGVTPAHRTVWRQAAAQWSNVANLTFIESEGAGNYIQIKNDTGNWSYVGMIGGEQEMGIFNWNFPFIVAHEIGHALGLKHEQSRYDRDSFVDVFWDNIEEDAKHNFDIAPSAATRGPYDFTSVMHYGRDAFSINGQDTLLPKPQYSEFNDVIGQRTRLSALDQFGMTLAYGTSEMKTRSCGDNAFLQLGYPTESWPFSYDPEPVGTFNLFASLDAGAWHSAGVDSSGHVYTWGHNNEGQLGDGTTNDRLNPTIVLGVSDVAYVSCGYAHSVALTRTGDVYCWGWNFYGQCGNGDASGQRVPAPYKVLGLPAITQISAGDNFNLAIDADGKVWGWGWNSFYNLSPTAGEYVRSPIIVVNNFSGNRAVKVAAGGNHCVAVDAAKNAWTWGWNGYGQIGDGTFNNSVAVPYNVMSGVVDVAAGVGHTVVLTNAGVVWDWGFNLVGQIGNGTSLVDQHTPYRLGLTNMIGIDAGGYHTMAIGSDGALWCWGGNTDGRLGLGDIVDKLTPVKNTAVSYVRAVSGGYHHALIQANMATLTMAVSPAGSATTTPAVGAHVVERNVQIPILAALNDGAFFVNWTATPAANAVFTNADADSTTVTVTGDVIVTANTTTDTEVTLTMVAAPSDGGVLAPEVGTHTVPRGAPVAIGAIAMPGYSFYGWVGDGPVVIANPSAQVTAATLTGNATVTAHFSQIPLFYHDADYNPANWQIDIFELLRVVALFNDGLYYKVDVDGPDGFNPSPVKMTFVPGTYHSADYNPADGQIDVFELSRVITLFNNGLYYKVDPSGPDGYAPSPTAP